MQIIGSFELTFCVYNIFESCATLVLIYFLKIRKFFSAK